MPPSGYSPIRRRMIAGCGNNSSVIDRKFKGDGNLTDVLYC
jgi:hypothetical protein